MTLVLPDERLGVIRARLLREGRVVAADLAREFSTSEDTIRRDLRELAAAGLCRRVYGGALPMSPASGTLAERTAQHAPSKQCLGQAAAALVRPGQSLCIDAGSTNLWIARSLPADMALHVTTNAPTIAAALEDKPAVNLVLLGGRLDRATGGTLGARALRSAEGLHFDLYFVGACAADPQAGLADFNEEEANLKRALAGQSAAVATAVTDDKLGTTRALPHGHAGRLSPSHRRDGPVGHALGNGPGWPPRAHRRRAGGRAMTSLPLSQGGLRRERAATFAVFLALGIAIGTWAAALPVLKTTLHLSAAELSIALLVLALASVASTLAAGDLAPRFGTGRSTLVAAVGTLLAFALPALAGSFWQLTLCTTAIGLTVGALDIGVNAHASDVERRWSAPIMSSFHAAFSLGGLLGASLGGLLAWAAWGVAVQIVLPLLVGGGVVLAAAPHLGPGARNATSTGVKLLLPERRALPLCAIALLCFLLEGAMADWSAVYLETVAGASAWGSAAGYAAFSIAMATGRLVGDGVVARVGQKRTVLIGGAIAAAGMGVALAVPSALWGAVGFALVGFGASNVVPVVFSRAGRYGSSPAAGVAMVATCGYAGFLGGPPLIGAVATTSGLRLAMVVVMMMPVLVMLAASRIDDADPRLIDPPRLHDARRRRRM